MKILYTAQATTTGGRDGHIESSDGSLNIDVRVPREMGGAGGRYANPEILFAAGYSACFDSALNLIIRMEKVNAGTTSVTAEVSLGKTEHHVYGLAVTLIVDVPGVERSVAESLVQKAHQVCPYSNATRGNIDVKLVVR